MSRRGAHVGSNLGSQTLSIHTAKQIRRLGNAINVAAATPYELVRATVRWPLSPRGRPGSSKRRKEMWRLNKRDLEITSTRPRARISKISGFYVVTSHEAAASSRPLKTAVPSSLLLQRLLSVLSLLSPPIGFSEFSSIRRSIYPSPFSVIPRRGFRALLSGPIRHRADLVRARGWLGRSACKQV